MAGPTKPAEVKVRMPRDLHRRIQREADQRGQTINAEILRRLEDSFRASGLFSKVEQAAKSFTGLVDKISADAKKVRAAAIAAGVNVDDDLDYAAWELARQVGVPRDVVLRLLKEEARKYDEPSRDKSKETPKDRPPTTKED